jgi:biopolymer transport protein ExbD
MAGSQDPSDNPVAVNVVPLVDIIFCLCVFFMCSFKFRQLEGKFETWLPKDHGVPDDPNQSVVPPSEIRVALIWIDATRTIERRFGSRIVPDDDDLGRSLAGARDAWMQKGRADAPLTIDADRRIPWSEVTNVVNLAKRHRIATIEFAMGAPPAARRGGR